MRNWEVLGKERETAEEGENARRKRKEEGNAGKIWLNKEGIDKNWCQIKLKKEKLKNLKVKEKN